MICFVSFRAVGRMEKVCVRGPARTPLGSYHHSGPLFWNVGWRDKESASLWSLPHYRETAWLGKENMGCCWSMWGSEILLQYSYADFFFVTLNLPMCLDRTVILPNPKELRIFWEEIFSLFFDRKVNHFLSPNDRKVKEKDWLVKISRVLNIYRTLIQNQRIRSAD